MFSHEVQLIQSMAQQGPVAVYMGNNRLHIVPTANAGEVSLCNAKGWHLIGIYQDTPVEWIEDDIKQVCRRTATQRAKALAKKLLA